MICRVDPHGTPCSSQFTSPLRCVVERLLSTRTSDGLGAGCDASRHLLWQYFIRRLALSHLPRAREGRFDLAFTLASYGGVALLVGPFALAYRQRASRPPCALLHLASPSRPPDMLSTMLGSLQRALRL